MSRDSWSDHDPYEPDELEPLDDAEGPQPCDLAGSTDSDADDVVPCPTCGREISELAERCPYCGDWIITRAGGRKRRPLWIAIAILLLILILLWVF